MDWMQIGLLFGAFGLVLLNGFFVAAEFAIVKVRPTQVEECAKGPGQRRAKAGVKVLEQLDDHLSATQLGITIASLGLGAIGEPALARLFQPMFEGLRFPAALAHTVALVIAFSLISFGHIVLGELAPKSLAIRKPLGTALWTAIPLRGFYWLMWPAIRVLNGAASIVLRGVGLGPVAEGENAHSPEELGMIVASSARHGLLDDQERLLLENVLGFREHYVHEIMVPRTDMVCLDTTQPLRDNLETIRDHPHTRYPLIIGDKDDIVGMIHVKDVIKAGLLGDEAFWQNAVEDADESVLETASATLEKQRRDRRDSADSEDPDGGDDGEVDDDHAHDSDGDDGDEAGDEESAALLPIARRLMFVPEVTTIDRLLRVFQKERVHLAGVVDEYGGIAGLVTLEDVLERLVGAIHDEFDPVEGQGIQRRPGGEVLVLGGELVETVAGVVGFDASVATVDTVAGFVAQLLGRVPAIGDFAHVGAFRVEVARMEGHRVTMVRFRPVAPEASGRAGAARRPSTGRAIVVEPKG